MVAEETTDSPVLGTLGPVEFRNLAYLAPDGWHLVDTLTGLRGCGALSDCSIQNAYGVVSVGPNDIVAGSNVKLTNNGDLLWTSGYVTLYVDVSPNEIVFARLLSNTSTFQGPFSLRVPKGMFVNIWLNAARVPSAGFLGALGAANQFQGWTGDVNSTNQSIKILLDRDKNISASWTTDYSGIVDSVVPLVMTVAVLVAVAFIALKHRRKTRRTSGCSQISLTSYSCPVCGESLFYVNEYGRYYCNKCQSYL
jgi:ribosomal protein S27AE